MVKTMLVDFDAVKGTPYFVPVMVAAMDLPVLKCIDKVMKEQMKHEKVRLREQHRALWKATLLNDHRWKAAFPSLHRRHSL